jgi:hypothetical protein
MTVIINCYLTAVPVAENAKEKRSLYAIYTVNGRPEFSKARISLQTVFFP